MPGCAPTGRVEALQIAAGNRTGFFDQNIDAACGIEQHTDTITFRPVKHFSTGHLHARTDAPSPDWICFASASRASRVRDAMCRSRPSAARRAAIARRIHSDAPVTSAVRPPSPGSTWVIALNRRRIPARRGDQSRCVRKTPCFIFRRIRLLPGCGILARSSNALCGRNRLADEKRATIVAFGQSC